MASARGQSVVRLAFQYPSGPHTRKHGPGGYSSYEQYRDWLRDEFSFRCIVCLLREQWAERVGRFHIDHVCPQSTHPHLRTSYANLVYLCVHCNQIKLAKSVPDPSLLNLQASLVVGDDGTIAAKDSDGQRLVDVFRLDSPDRTEYRAKLMQALRCIEQNGSGGIRDWLGYPRSLPDLRRKRAPVNTRPQGADDCCYALRERGQLPDLY